MLDQDFAGKFIERVTRFTDYNVNIMDERGIIIASRDKKRIGQYHEIAYRLIAGTEEMIDTTGMSFPNVLPGINMVIAAGGKREGVVGVTGDPEEVRPVALMVKMAFETMLKYEQQLDQQRIRKNKKEHFLYLLTQVEHSNPDELRSYARDLGYPEESIRIPILIRLENPGGRHTDEAGKTGPAGPAEEAGRAGRAKSVGTAGPAPGTGAARAAEESGKAGMGGEARATEETGAAAEALRLLQGGALHSYGDFSFVMDSRHILVYKTIPAETGRDGSLFSDYKQLVREYLEPLERLDRRSGRTIAESSEAIQKAEGKRKAEPTGGQLSGRKGKSFGNRRDPGPVYTAFAGSFQEIYPQYYYGYRHCRWLEQNVKADCGEPVFFYDHLGEYMRSMLPASELQRAFYVYRSCIPEQKLRSCAETIGALIRTNYNFGRAAELLFIHKNTLVYRYRGLKEILGVDPMVSAGDRAFLELFYAYLLHSSSPEDA